MLGGESDGVAEGRAEVGLAMQASLVVETSWVSEAQKAASPNKTCSTGDLCGHYTQVIWAKSCSLGLPPPPPLSSLSL